jgi:hypothetical protein
VKYRILSVVVVAAIGLAVVPGAASATVAAKPKKVSTGKYAKILCATYNQVVKDINGFLKQVDSIAINDNASFQTQVGSLGNGVLTKLKVAEKRLKGVYPDISDGKKISKLFAKNTVELQTALTGTLGTFAKADPNGVAFQADVAVLSAGLGTLGTKISDVTSQINDQDLIGSIGDEKSCHAIFPVTGG